MTSPRNYTIGLPVTITIDDAGAVTYEVDFSEVTRGIEDSCEYDEEGNELVVDDEVFAADYQHLDAAVTAHYQDGPRLAPTRR